MTFSTSTVQQIALQRFAKEVAEQKAAEEKLKAEAAAAQAAIAEAHRLARIRAEQEREEARIRAERALAEEKIREEAAALEAAVEEELERLRNRTEVEVLRDELAEMKKQLCELKCKPTTLVIPSKSFCAAAAGGGGQRWMGCLKINPSTCGWVDPTPGTEKELWLVYKDYNTGHSVERQTKLTERQEMTIQAFNLEIVSAIWRGKVFGGRTEGYGPRSVPLSFDNPYKKTYNPACPMGELDVSDSLRSMVCVVNSYRPTLVLAGPC